ncbi:MAG: hypothetical protein ACRD33_04160 [Candidatus Acidiferrales bacterium]
MARFLGVSHTWVNKLVKRIEADPERMRRRMRAFAPANVEKLERAREETRRQRERGRLRGPIRYRRVKVMLEGRKKTVAVVTQPERRRRGDVRQAHFGVERDCASRAGAASPAPTSAMHVAYRELPSWARGLLLPGDPGTGMRRTPRPVPFAFRRRR